MLANNRGINYRVVKLGDIATVIAGQSPKGNNYNKEGKGTPFYQGKKDYGERYLKKPTVWTKKVTKEALAEDILLSVRAPVGSINIASERICIGRGLAAIRAGRKVNRDYLYYFLKMIGTQLKGSSGAIFNSINKKQIESISIPLLPLEEQKAIVAKFNKVFAEIDKVIETTEVAASLSIDGFSNLINIKTKKQEGWIEFRVADLGKVQTGNTPKTSQQDNYGIYIPFVKPPHFNANGTLTLAEDGLSENGMKSSRILKRNSVMMVCIGATIGKVAINDKDVCFNQQINAVTPIAGYDKDLIYWQMRGRRFQRDVLSRAGKATLPIISKSKWEQLLIYLPKDIEEQILLSKELRKISDLTDEFVKCKMKKLQELYTLKSAILTQELQVRQYE